MKKSVILIAMIFIIALALRFYNLSEVPVGFHRDEAFLGYNAYSILKTGKDMSGAMLPLHLESFIYSPAGYSYFSIPFIYLFDLSEFSVRLASAFFGSLTALIIYFLGKSFFKRVNTVALFSAILFAISPWHINLSRTATENVLVVFFLLLGILFFIRYTKGGYRFLVLSFLCFSITLFLYQAARAFLPIFVPFLVLVLGRNKIIKDKFILGFFYLATIILPIFFILISPNLSLRIRSLSIFHNDYTNIVLTEQAANDGEAKLPYIATRVFHNKVMGHSLSFLNNYFKHFNLDFLFLDNSFPERYRVPFVGLFYVFELPLIFLGIFYLFQKDKKIAVFLLGWIIITPIGSALTFDDIPNMQRTLISLPAFSFLSACGLIIFLDSLSRKNRYLYITSILVVSFIIIYSLSYYLVQYYTQAIRYKTWNRQDGYKNLVNKVNTLLPNYKKAIITNRESAPTVFFLFYSKYDPKLFQKDIKASSHRSFDRVNFGKYEFTEDECPLRNILSNNIAQSSGEKNVLYVNSALCKEFPLGVRVLKEIKRNDNSSVFYILDSK